MSENEASKSFQGDLDNVPQSRKKVHVFLLDPQNRPLLNRKRAEIWAGKPIGAWIEWQGRRIALNYDASDNTYAGQVPDEGTT